MVRRDLVRPVMRARPDVRRVAFAVVHAPACFSPRARGRGAAGDMLGPTPE